MIPIVQEIKPNTYNLKQQTNFNFKGIITSEKLKKNISNGTRDYLIQETAFFREADTLEFVKTYIENNLKHKSNINILDGACSKGYETYSLAMMLESLKQKINITGFDIGEDAIKEAKQGIFRIYKIKNNLLNYLSKFVISGYQDSYLAFTKNKNLSEKQLEYKNIFNKYYTDITPHTKTSWKQNLKELILSPQKLEEKIFKLKPNKAKKCKFIQGNILELDKFITKNSIDVLLFRNALYHLTTEEGGLGCKITLPDDKVISVIKNIVDQIDRAIAPNGLFVIGEHPADHVDNVGNILYNELKKHNFKPVYINSLGTKVKVWVKNKI